MARSLHEQMDRRKRLHVSLPSLRATRKEQSLSISEASGHSQVVESVCGAGNYPLLAVSISIRRRRTAEYFEAQQRVR